MGEVFRNPRWKFVPELRSLTIRQDTETYRLKEVPRLARARCDFIVAIPDEPQPFDANVIPDTLDDPPSPPTPPPKEEVRISSTHVPPLNLAISSKASITYLDDLGLPMGASGEWGETLAAAKMLIDEEVRKVHSWGTFEYSLGTRKERGARLAQRFEHILGLLERFGANEQNVPYFYVRRNFHGSLSSAHYIVDGPYLSTKEFMFLFGHFSLWNLCRFIRNRSSTNA